MISTTQHHDPLLAACCLVGAALGITIRSHPEDRAASSRRDPLADIAAASRVRMRHVLLRGDWWRHDNGPLLAYREADKQPVALLPRSPRHYLLIDPLRNTRTPVTGEVAATLASFAVTFYRPLPERPLQGRDILRYAVVGTRRDLLAMVSVGLASGVLALATPLATNVIFSTIIPAGQRPQLVLIAGALIVSALAVAAFSITRNIALLRVQTRTNATLQAGVVDRLINLPVGFFRSYMAGDLGDRAMGISTIQQTLSDTTITSILAAIFGTFSLGLLFYYNVLLALIVCGLVLIWAIVTGVAGVVQARRYRTLATQHGEISGQVLQFILAIAKFRVAGAEQRAFTRWAQRFSALKRTAYEAETVGNMIASWNAAYPIVLSLLIMLTIVATNAARLSTGEFLAFTAASAQFVAALLALSTAATQVLSVAPLYEAIAPILQTPPEVDEARVHPGELRGAVSVDHVSFRYAADGPLILDDVSIHIQSGEFVALVGPSGSGKSTLLRLLLGFEQPAAGAIRYDDHDLAVVDVREVRRQIGVVLQNGALMADDIYHNIIGSSLLSVDDAWEAARMVGIAAEIEQLPMGMHTMVPEGGSTFSGGQRQRLLIARAVVHKPKILFFDEATSALDNTTQAIVSDNLARLNVTRIVVAHRLSTIMHADRIYVLDGGHIVQSGTYADLIHQDGLFATLARRQIA